MSHAPLPLLLLAAVSSLGLAQEAEHGYTPAEVERGQEIFFTNCISCHGPAGDGVPGVKLASGRFRHATSDQELANIVIRGIPGTPMPPGNFSDREARLIVAYLRSMAALSTATPASSLTGDPARGKALFEGKGQCLTCHRINGAGAFLGPDLAEIGARRPAAELVRSLTDPNAQIRTGNRTVRAVQRDGAVTLGALLNQDTYTIQIIQANGKLTTLAKAGLRDFEVMTTSPMPSFSTRLSPQELADVVAYLASLKGQR